VFVVCLAVAEDGEINDIAVTATAERLSRKSRRRLGLFEEKEEEEEEEESCSSFSLFDELCNRNRNW
jgi:hypothetical protein